MQKLPNDLALDLNVSLDRIEAMGAMLRGACDHLAEAGGASPDLREQVNSATYAIRYFVTELRDLSDQVAALQPQPERTLTMTTKNPAAGNAPGFPVPSLDEIHNMAVRLSGVLKAIACLDGENLCAEGKAALILVAEDLALDLERAIDSANTTESEG